MSSTFGEIFRVTTFGESHGKAVGAIVDGCPPKLKLTEEDIQLQLNRRRPGQSSVSTPRSEQDRVTILSGTENGMTLGTPIGLSVANKDQRPGDYSTMAPTPRPSHADFTYLEKYGIKASSGGGRSSARETIGRVASGAIAEKVLQKWYSVDIVAWVSSVGTITAPSQEGLGITRAQVDETAIRCPHKETGEQMQKYVEGIKEENDSVGGVVTCEIRNVPAGLGEPVFGKIEAKLAQAMLSIPATKGFEVGSGFTGSTMRGSAHNDPFIMKGARLGTSTNFSGGIQGGITNGEDIVLRVAFKPAATIGRAQNTIDYNGNSVVLENKGRHDPCVVPRAIAVVEAMAALAILDAALIQKTRK